MPSRKYTYDDMYREEYSKGKAFLWGREPDEYVVWIGNHLEEMGFMQARILDVGCGEGRHCIYLAKRGFVTYGVDVASLPIEKGRKWAEEEGLSGLVDLRVGDATRLPYEGGFFDAVIDIYTIQFIRERGSYVREVARALKPNGLFFIRTNRPPAKHSVNEEELGKMLKESFEILQIESSVNSTVLKVMAKRKEI